MNSFDLSGSPCFPSELGNCWGDGDVILEWMFPRAVGFFLRGQTVSQARTRKCWMNLQHNCWANQCQAWKFYGGPWWHVGWYFRHWVLPLRQQATVCCEKFNCVVWSIQLIILYCLKLTAEPMTSTPATRGCPNLKIHRRHPPRRSPNIRALVPTNTLDKPRN